MRTCENCHWADRCPDVGQRCEYYDPLLGDENAAMREYRQDLKEREEEYQEVIDEQNS